jgi:uncharacterized protein YkwD
MTRQAWPRILKNNNDNPLFKNGNLGTLFKGYCIVATPTSLETLFLQLVNEARANVGAKPLTFDDELLDSSDAHSAWMDQTDTFSHTGVNGSDPGDRMGTAGYGAQGWGENIAYVSGGMTEATVRQLHTNLMNSPGHYANIVRGSFEEIGIGLKEGTINGHSVVFVTQNFGTPNSAEGAEADGVGTTTTADTTPTPPPTDTTADTTPTPPPIDTTGIPSPPIPTPDTSMKQAKKEIILSQIEGIAEDLAAGDLQAGVFRFGGVKVKVFEPTSDCEGGSVEFDIKARKGFAEEVQDILSLLDAQFGDSVDTPVVFDDMTPDSPNAITDRLRIDHAFTPAGLNLDLIDI